MYHYVCPAKYRRVVFSEALDNTLKETCLEISKRYQIHFLEIGTDDNHVHFLVQSVPMYKSDKNSDNNKKYHSQRSFSYKSGSKTKVVGRGVLDRWLLCEHS